MKFYTTEGRVYAPVEDCESIDEFKESCTDRYKWNGMTVIRFTEMMLDCEQPHEDCFNYRVYRVESIDDYSKDEFIDYVAVHNEHCPAGDESFWEQN